MTAILLRSLLDNGFIVCIPYITLVMMLSFWSRVQGSTLEANIIVLGQYDKLIELLCGEPALLKRQIITTTRSNWNCVISWLQGNVV